MEKLHGRYSSHTSVFCYQKNDWLIAWLISEVQWTPLDIDIDLQ